METTFTLHAHEASASGDSTTPIETMAEAYAEKGVDVVGFVGHDERPDIPDGLPIEAMAGTEHEARRNPTRLHIIDFPEQNLRILPHPSLTYPENTTKQAAAAAETWEVDAVEVFNRGGRELPSDADVGVPKVAGDDAHNTHQTASSYNVTRARATPQAVASAVKRGDFQPINEGLPRRRAAAGKLHQGVAMLAERMKTDRR